MKHILVTGGAGFLGSHLCKKLLENNNKVTALDNFSSGNRNNLLEFIENPQFNLIKHDITTPLNLDVDEIFNLACPASPVFYQNDPIQTTKTCIYGSINMLELAKKNNAKILQASTSEVYGDPIIHPQHESYWGNVNPNGIRSCYDEGKRCAESLFFDFFRLYDVKIKVARIFNTYGPNMQIDDGRVISNFIVQALKSSPLTIYGDGSQTRSFCYVEDLIDGLIKLMNSKDGITGPINLGNPDEYSINQIAEIIIKFVGSSSSIIYKTLPKDDPKKRKPSIKDAITKLDWEPKTKLNNGLEETIKYFKKIIKN